MTFGHNDKYEPSSKRHAILCSTVYYLSMLQLNRYDPYREADIIRANIDILKHKLDIGEVNPDAVLRANRTINQLQRQLHESGY